MKILVFADSHNDVDTMRNAVTLEQPNRIVHLGDHLSDGFALQNFYNDMPVYLVKGNTDSDVYDEEIVINAESIRVFATHGHRYDVDGGLEKLYNEGTAAEAKVILYGHTHTPYLSYVDGIWIMNPGRIGKKPGKAIHSTYGIIQIERSKLGCAIVEA